MEQPVAAVTVTPPVSSASSRNWSEPDRLRHHGGGARRRAALHLSDVPDAGAVLCVCFACAFNLLIGYGGLLSFGHALYFGWASYLAAHSAKVWGLPRPSLRSSPGRSPAPCSASWRARWRSAGRASIFCHDHARPRLRAE